VKIHATIKKGVGNNLPTFIHWFSWTISLLASVFFVIFLLNEGIPDIMKGKGKELIAFVPWLILAIIGCGLSFFRIRPGAIAMITGGIAMVIVIAVQSGMRDFGIMVVYGTPYILPGLFFLLVRNPDR
jgi:hypothetical protein